LRRREGLLEKSKAGGFGAAIDVYAGWKAPVKSKRGQEIGDAKSKIQSVLIKVWLKYLH
jgi:hypothetical protein